MGRQVGARSGSFAGPAPSAPVAELANGRPRARFIDRFMAGFVDSMILWIGVFPLPILGRFTGFFVGTVYYVAPEGGASGRTLGKRLLGLRVVDHDTGSSIGYARALLRHLGRILSFVVFGLGYLWMLWDPNKQTWHDKMARSVVVRDRDWGRS